MIIIYGSDTTSVQRFNAETDSFVIALIEHAQVLLIKLIVTFMDIEI